MRPCKPEILKLFHMGKSESWASCGVLHLRQLAVSLYLAFLGFFSNPNTKALSGYNFRFRCRERTSGSGVCMCACVCVCACTIRVLKGYCILQCVSEPNDMSMMSKSMGFCNSRKRVFRQCSSHWMHQALQPCETCVCLCCCHLSV